jgi:uncharacterized membrane protein YphA (DoxX/SURF4 family)
VAKKTPQPNWGIVIVRVTIGMALVHAGGQKIVQGVGPWIVESTAHRVASSPFFFNWWGNQVLLRWPDLFAHVLSWGCLVLGGLMFLGALTRPVGWAIAFLMANVYFAGPVNYRELVALIAICAIACSVSRAGRRVGFDELLEQRLPAWLTWVRG